MFSCFIIKDKVFWLKKQIKDVSVKTLCELDDDIFKDSENVK